MRPAKRTQVNGINIPGFLYFEVSLTVLLVLRAACPAVNPRFNIAGGFIVYTILALSPSRLDELAGLFAECFIEDPYYARVFPGPRDRLPRMKEMIRQPLDYCLERGGVYGIEADGAAVAFMVYLDYHRLRHEDPRMYHIIFTGENEKTAPCLDRIKDQTLKLGEHVMYLLLLGVRKEYRNRGMAGELVDFLIRSYPCHRIVSDVSNEGSLGMYRRRGFVQTRIDGDMCYVRHEPAADLPALYLEDDGIYLMLPDLDSLAELGREGDAPALPEGGGVVELKLPGYEAPETPGGRFFVKRPGAVSRAYRVRVSYKELLKYQRYINLSDFSEEYIPGDPPALIYTQNIPHREKPLWNDTLREMVKTREKEWDIVPDIEILVPVEYRDAGRLGSGAYDSMTASFIRFLDFRTRLEAGVSRDIEGFDPSSFKNRIRRFYLGKVKLKICSELTAVSCEDSGDQIGAAADVDLMVSIDTLSRCGVLSILSLSTPFLISQLMDCTIRNQLILCDGEREHNFFSYAGERFCLFKRGTPKSYVLIPEQRQSLDEHYIASLLMSETIYAADEEYGKFTDPAVMDLVKSEYGMGQYDRAFICISSNVLLQIGALRSSVEARLYEESIAFNFIEILLLEEAAIEIAAANIRLTLSKNASTASLKILRNTLNIHKEYAKTIEFWDIQMSYPSAKRSIYQIRTAFGMDGILARMKRDTEELQIVFNTQTEIIDRVESSILNYIMMILTFIQAGSILLPHVFGSDGGSGKLLGTGFFGLLILLFWWLKRIFLK
jgi:ribosomal protein S18 acetylase RimI-like enzyme